MDTSAQPDRISTLPDEVLILIISDFHLKSDKHSLSKKWRYLYRETRNLAFREADFVSPSLYGQHRIYARNALVKFVFRWIARIQYQPDDSFEICISNPKTYYHEIHSRVRLHV
ncbi:unnamed protein product [Brassica oleracea var. botrytis]|uniref:F-box domain-containing protein n=1 Tax=Brassica oleracea TaxID=3712 RepID=A0A3P6EI35_BRAOL|nr:unnamed protein product [Brassica oleracea]